MTSQACGVDQMYEVMSNLIVFLLGIDDLHFSDFIMLTHAEQIQKIPCIWFHSTWSNTHATNQIE